MIRITFATAALAGALTPGMVQALPLLAPPPVEQRQGQALISQGALCPALQTPLRLSVAKPMPGASAFWTIAASRLLM